MKKVFKLVLVLLFLAGGVFVFATESDTVVEGSSSIAESRTLYRQHCAVCHGTDGRSNTKKGRETEASDISGSGDSVDKIVRVITNGKGEMPGFRGKMSASQIASVARYVKTL